MILKQDHIVSRTRESYGIEIAQNERRTVAPQTRILHHAGQIFYRSKVKVKNALFTSNIKVTTGPSVETSGEQSSNRKAVSEKTKASSWSTN